MRDRLRLRDNVVLGVLLGVGFGVCNLILTYRDPLADDTIPLLLTFYGPMFAIWGLAGFTAARRTGRLLNGVRAAATVAFVTFVVFDIAVIVRVNLFLDAIRHRADWQNMVVQFEASEFDSFRTYANYRYVTGAPFKILVATMIGAGTGLVGGVVGSVGRHKRVAIRGTTQ